MKTEFDITLESRDLYRFTLHHTYTGAQGILSVVVAILAFAAAAATRGTVSPAYTVVYILFGILFLVYLPLSLYLKTMQQFKTAETFRRPLHYCLDDTGVHTSQGDAQADLPWEQIYRIVATKNNLLIYSTRINAYVIPREQIREEYAQIRTLAEAHLPGYRRKMKGN